MSEATSTAGYCGGRRGSARALCLLLLVALRPAQLLAQEAGQVDTLARLLAVEDTRQLDLPLLRAASGSRSVLVRQRAALAAGRVGGEGVRELLTPLLADREAAVRANAAFALGLLHDSAAVPALLERLSVKDEDDAAAMEVVSAIARSGGSGAAAGIAALLRRPPQGHLGDLRVRTALLESWRLGSGAALAQLVTAARVRDPETRWPAVYALARLRAPRGWDELLVALDDERPLIRATAALAITRRFGDSARADRRAVVRRLSLAVDDRDDAVRTNALTALGTWRDSTVTGPAIAALNARDANVAVRAAITLGETGGRAAADALANLLDRGSFLAQEAAALEALARLDSTRTRAHLPPFATSRDSYRRAAGARAVALARFGIGALAPFLADTAPGVAAAALSAWREREGATAPGLADTARRLLGHSASEVRAAAAEALGALADTADRARLTTLARQAVAAGDEEVARTAVEALSAIAKRAPAADDTARLRTIPSTYLLRRWAARAWPVAAAAWGPPGAARVARPLEEYRALVTRFLLPGSAERRVRVRVQLAREESLELELFGDTAPFTVANFLALADSGWFDRHRWHRVVPNFVAQDGEPGAGQAPVPAIRDELNPLRYRDAMLGMALSGPDTGTSEWFITLAPAPHLDAAYTIFGRLAGPREPLARIAQGDPILGIRR